MNFLYKTRGNSSPKSKPRVYFTCFPTDFSLCFEKICEDILKTHNCAIYYTADMTLGFDAQELESMNLFVIPVTHSLLTIASRAMEMEMRYAKENNIPILPIMMEPGLDALYANKFGELQYINPYSTDRTEIKYEDKLKKYLDSVLISDETAKRIRAAFDAYIFLSYRKKDRKYANELLRMIHANPEYRDIAVWYDEFLTPGESFYENIGKVLSNSKLFALLVTPSLLEDQNFVMTEEYPTARASGMNIIPVEMESTDRATLEEKYNGIPDCVDPRDSGAFKKRLQSALAKAATAEDKGNPEHTFLIGLAYLDGIDVEVNRERGIELITEAGDAGLIEAVKKLVEIYDLGIGTNIDHLKTIYWLKKLINLNAKRILDRKGKDVDFDEIVDYINSVLRMGVKYYDVSNYEEAVKNYLDIIDFSKKFRIYLGLNSDIFASAAYNNLGIIEREAGHGNEANSYYLKAISMREKILRKHPDVIVCDLMSSYINAAIYYNSAGLFKSSLRMLEKADALYRKYKVDALQQARIHNIRGSAYSDMGERKKSIEEYLNAFEILTDLMNSPSDPVTLECADTLYNMGIHYVDSGNNDKAVLSFRQSVIYYSQLASKDIDTYLSPLTRAYEELALVYQNQGKYEDAMRMIEAAEKLCLSSKNQTQDILLRTAKVLAAKADIIFHREHKRFKEHCADGVLSVADYYVWYSESPNAYKRAEEYMLRVELNQSTAIHHFSLYSQMGSMYYHRHDNDKSQECYHKAYNLHRQYYYWDKSKQKQLGILYLNFSFLCYHNYHDKNASREMIDKAIKIFIKTPGCQDLCQKAYEFKGKYLGYFDF